MRIKRTKITVVGTHRNAKLAEKHLSALLRKYNPEKAIMQRRNESGKFSERGHLFTFTLTLRAKMFESILAVTYPYRTNKKGGAYFSFVGRFFTEKRPTIKVRNEQKKKLVKELRKSLDAQDKPLWFHPYRSLNVSTKEVPFDGRINSSSFEDERQSLQR